MNDQLLKEAREAEVRENWREAGRIYLELSNLTPRPTIKAALKIKAADCLDKVKP